MSSLLERVKALAIKVEAELPEGVEKITLVVEQKAEAVEAAVKSAVPPEVETWLSKIEASIESHTSALAHLFEKHAAPVAAPSATPSAAQAGLAAVAAAVTPAAPAVPTSDAVPVL